MGYMIIAVVSNWNYLFQGGLQNNILDMDQYGFYGIFYCWIHCALLRFVAFFGGLRVIPWIVTGEGFP